MSPTARSLAWLRREGFTAAVVEKWLPHVNVRADLWKFADVLAVHPGERIFLLVQVTSLGNVSSRLAKARTRPELATWLRAGGSFGVHGWQKRGTHWQLKRIAVQPEDLQPVLVQAPPRRRKAGRPLDLFDVLEAPAERAVGG